MIKYKINICGEQNIPIRHCLLSKNKSLRNITKIYAHNQTLSQCDLWISKNLPNAQRFSMDSNAQAALNVRKINNSACIASDLCGKMYKLNIIC